MHFGWHFWLIDTRIKVFRRFTVHFRSWLRSDKWESAYSVLELMNIYLKKKENDEDCVLDFDGTMHSDVWIVATWKLCKKLNALLNRLTEVLEVWRFFAENEHFGHNYILCGEWHRGIEWYFDLVNWEYWREAEIQIKNEFVNVIVIVWNARYRSRCCNEKNACSLFGSKYSIEQPTTQQIITVAIASRIGQPQSCPRKYDRQS